MRPFYKIGDNRLRVPDVAFVDATIELYYSATLFLDDSVTFEQENRFYDQLFRTSSAKRYKGVKLTTTNGGAAHSGYVTISGPSLKRVDDLVQRTRNIALRKRVKFIN